jgi:Rho termination factor, N-terminal domain
MDFAPQCRGPVHGRLVVVERVPKPERTERITLADRRDYTVAELRQIAREHQVRRTSRMTHDELVKVLTARGIDLPAKPLQRMPYKR